jgi:hypothetical protein
VPKIPRKYSLKKPATLFITEETNNVEGKGKKHRENKVKEQRNQKCKQSQFFRSTRSENAGKRSK